MKGRNPRQHGGHKAEEPLYRWLAADMLIDIFGGLLNNLLSGEFRVRGVDDITGRSCRFPLNRVLFIRIRHEGLLSSLFHIIKNNRIVKRRLFTPYLGIKFFLIAAISNRLQAPGMKTSD
jgi:hypothetical protein